jgi:FkbM family methyltransferase
MQLSHVGTAYGGWMIPTKLLTSSAICYCVGAGEDISFDIALVEDFGCDVFSFDPTPKAIAHVDELIKRSASGMQMLVNNDPTQVYRITDRNLCERFHFSPIGLLDDDICCRFYAPRDKSHASYSVDNIQKTEEYVEATCKKLTTVMSDLNHHRVDLLKLDIEGAEIRVLRQMISSKIRPKIICVEFDSILRGTDKGGARRVVNDLQRYGYRIVYNDNWNITFVETGNEAIETSGHSLIKRVGSWLSG